MFAFLRKSFLTGLLAITPLAITSWILFRFYNLISSGVRPWVLRIPSVPQAYPEFFLTFIGVVSFVLLIMLVGIFTRNLIGMAFFRLVERFIERIPVVKSVFSAIKQIAEVFLQDRRTAFKDVALVEYPRKGIFSLGFVTRNEIDDEIVTVFIATSPNPTSGFMIFVPKDDLQILNIPVEDAIKLVVSSGAVMTGAQAGEIKQQIGLFSAGAESSEGMNGDR